jgi:hypothetical protein
VLRYEQGDPLLVVDSHCVSVLQSLQIGRCCFCFWCSASGVGSNRRRACTVFIAGIVAALYVILSARLTGSTFLHMYHVCICLWLNISCVGALWARPQDHSDLTPRMLPREEVCGSISRVSVPCGRDHKITQI